jgi:hypothetical protein
MEEAQPHKLFGEEERDDGRGSMEEAQPEPIHVRLLATLPCV